MINKYFITLKTNILSFFLILLLCVSINSSYAAIAQSPLFLTSSVDPNILFNMSVEVPMGGAAYNDQPDDQGCGGRVNDGGTVGICYVKTNTYLGYFNPNRCYQYANNRFNPRNATNSNHECSGKFSGNFLNWATMTAIDMFTWTMTGGNRIVDNVGNLTVVRRMRKQNNDGWFPHKLISATRNVAPSTVTPWGSGKIYIHNTDFGVEFGTSRGGSNKGTYRVDIRVCNKNKALESNCVEYEKASGRKYYKPEGLIQKNADHMRFGVTSFTNTSTREMGGGVLRSNIKYVGTYKPDGSGGVVINSEKEINSDGTLNLNPNPGDAAASSVSKSGVIPFINKFSDVSYKGIDPASELFYESIRYFKNLGPTPEYLTGLNGGFPILGANRWQDPITESCQKNFIIGINDAFPWVDKKLPGTYFNTPVFNGHTLIGSDFGQPSNPDGDINVTALTNKVGALQGINGTSRPVGCTANDCNMTCSNKIIPGLGEVFGTCQPWAGRENSYYIAGLAYYANTQDIRSDFDGKQTINTFMIDSQEFNSNPPLGEMNMLWLAGKYGGFHDFNDNGTPDDQVVVGGDVVTPSEWDVDGDNEPDNYVLATSPGKLVGALNKAFSDINGQISSASAVAANSSHLNLGSQVFQAKFNSKDWSGQLQAFSIDLSTGALTPSWEASALLPDHGSRKIYTYDPTASVGSRGVVFQWANLTTTPLGASQQDYLNMSDNGGELRVGWLRGDDDKEIKKAGGIFRNRTNPLGDIVNSDPLYVGGFDYGFAASGAGHGSYDAYLTYTSNRRPMLYMGANDGMFHGFDASASGGQEIFAYIPNALFPNLANLTSINYYHQYFVDGMSASSDAYNGSAWRTILASTTGAGGRAVFALDVTDPDSFTASSALWEFTHADDSDLGYTLAQPEVVRLQDGHFAVIVSNGYDSDSGHAVLFVLDAFTGAVLQKIDTGVGTVGNKNGLSSPLAVDTNNDRSIDTVYAGDLYGNLWKFNLLGNTGTWPVPANPIFVACTNSDASCSAVNRQPITAKPNVGKVSSDQGSGTMVYFGTGKYFASNDNIVGSTPQIQSFYGLWDEGTAISNRSFLQEQSINSEGHVITDAGSLSIHPIRMVSDNPVCYTVTSDGCDSSSALKKGWALNLLSPSNGAEGERSVSYPLVRRGVIVFATAIPNSDVCSFGGRSWLMEVNALTGGKHIKAPFDIDGDGKVDANDLVGGDAPAGINQEIGITKTPAVVEGAIADDEESGVDYKYSSGSTGSMGTVVDAGATAAGSGRRRAWWQLI